MSIGCSWDLDTNGISNCNDMTRQVLFRVLHHLGKEIISAISTPILKVSITSPDWRISTPFIFKLNSPCPAKLLDICMYTHKNIKYHIYIPRGKLKHSNGNMPCTTNTPTVWWWNLHSFYQTVQWTQMARLAYQTLVTADCWTIPMWNYILQYVCTYHNTCMASIHTYYQRVVLKLMPIKTSHIIGYL